MFTEFFEEVDVVTNNSLLSLLRDVIWININQTLSNIDTMIHHTYMFHKLFINICSMKNGRHFSRFNVDMYYRVQDLTKRHADVHR